MRGDVLGVPVVVVAGVTRGLGEQRVLGPLERPDVGVDVAALDLVTRGRRAPEEAVREPASSDHDRLSEFRVQARRSLGVKGCEMER